MQQKKREKTKKKNRLPSIVQRISLKIRRTQLVLPDAFSCVLHGRFAQRMHRRSCDLLACHRHACHAISSQEPAAHAAHADCFDYFAGDFVAVADVAALVCADSGIEIKKKNIAISYRKKTWNATNYLK